jgi:diguanylate cyclase (GGDEF)-like protein
MAEFDLSLDLLADAPLTPEQRRVWNFVRGELATSIARNQELEHRLQKLEQPAVDPETSILARPEFNREVARMLAFDERYGGISSVLYIDFENLEATAERYGQSVANAATRAIGAVLVKNIRGSDIIGRLAPDEFGVLLMRCDNAAAWKKAEILAFALQKAVTEVNGCRLDLRISYGAYTFRDHDDVANGLKEAAHSMTRASLKAENAQG